MGTSERSVQELGELRQSRPRLLLDERLHVLIVDDNVELVNYVTLLLQSSCEVASAYDARTGLVLAKSRNPDLVVLDLQLPDLHGIELLREIRHDPAIHTIPVIMLSGDATEEARVDALNGGADDYLVKPFKPRELIARIHSHVRMVRLRRSAIERERALLRELAAARRDLKCVLARTSDAFISCDRSLVVIECNEAALSMVGAQSGSLEGRALLDVASNLRNTPLADTLLRSIRLEQMGAVEHYSPAIQRWYGVRCYATPDGVTVFAADITEQKEAQRALVAAHAQLEDRVAQRTEELRALYHRMESVREEERVALAREVHDQLGQLLSAAKIDIRLLEDEIRVHKAEFPKRKALLALRSACLILEQGIERVRAIATELRPPELDGDHFYGAIAAYCAQFQNRTRIRCEVDLLGAPATPEAALAVALYRIVQEALINVLRHANASRVRVMILQRATRILFRIMDDGVGIGRRQAAAPGSLGLRGMRERARNVGGRVLVGRVPQGGTLVSISVPLSPLALINGRPSAVDRV